MRCSLLPRLGLLLIVVAASCAGLVTPAVAVYWNNDPAFGNASATGLTDRHGWFQNVHVINNGTNNTRGTTSLLNSEWAITVRHVVQNGGDYGQIAPPGSILVDVGGQPYYADQIFTPDGGSEIALLQLRGGVAGALDMTGQINTSFDETGRYVEIGGYGYHGYINTTGAGGTQPGTASGSVSFHRAYNVPWVPGQVQIIADGESQLASNGLLEGIAGPGDSGGPMFGYYGSGAPTGGEPLSDWRLIGLTATSSGGTGGAAWGGLSNYTRVAAYSGFIAGTLAAYGPGESGTQPWVQASGTGLYDSGGDKISVRGSGALPAVQAAFGPGGSGFTLNTIGETLSFSAVLDTTLSMGDTAIHYGMFDDEGGTIPGDVSGGTPWNGYYTASASEGMERGVYEKGPNGGGVGQWWSNSAPNSAFLFARGTKPSGTFDDGGGLQDTPAGRYQLSLDYTRVTEGLEITWAMESIDSLGAPDGVYSHVGTRVDASPASDSWTYNQLGIQLLNSGYSSPETILLDDIEISFANVPSADLNGDNEVDIADWIIFSANHLVDLSGYNQVEREAHGDLDTDGDNDYDDFVAFRTIFNSVNGAGTLEAAIRLVPEPSTGLSLLVALCLVGARRRGVRDDAQVTPQQGPGQGSNNAPCKVESW